MSVKTIHVKENGISTASGKMITLKNALPGTLLLNKFQKNYLKNNMYIVPVTNYEGFTITLREDSSWVANGTPPAPYVDFELFTNIYLSELGLKKGHKYFLKGNVTGGTFAICPYGNHNTSFACVDDYFTYNAELDVPVDIIVRFYHDITFDNVEIGLGIYDYNHDYVPYNYEVITCGRNLYRPVYGINRCNCYYEINEDNEITLIPRHNLTTGMYIGEVNYSIGERWQPVNGPLIDVRDTNSIYIGTKYHVFNSFCIEKYDENIRSHHYEEILNEGEVDVSDCSYIIFRPGINVPNGGFIEGQKYTDAIYITRDITKTEFEDYQESVVRINPFMEGPIQLRSFEGETNIISISSEIEVSYATNINGKEDLDAYETLNEDTYNENLILNSNFKINQRGNDIYNWSNYSALLYTCDRWALDGRGEVSYSNNDSNNSIKDCIIIKSLSMTGSCDFCQNFETDLPEGFYTTSIYIPKLDLGATYRSKLYISFYKRRDESLFGKRYELHEGMNIITEYLQGVTFFTFDFLFGAIAYIKWIKIEKGIKATEYREPVYTEELIKCQRWFELKTETNIATTWNSSNQNKRYYAIANYIEKRIVPSISFTGIHSYEPEGAPIYIDGHQEAIYKDHCLFDFWFNNKVTCNIGSIYIDNLSIDAENYNYYHS